MLATVRLTATVLLCGILALGLAGAVPIQAQDPQANSGDSPPATELPYEIHEISSGLWAALQPAPLRFNDSNSLVIQTDAGVVVIDSQTDPRKVELLAAEIRRRTGQAVRYVINTHWHGDHTQGNAVYAQAAGETEPAIFIAHTSWWRDVQDRGLPQLAEDLDTTRAAIARAEEQLANGRTADGVAMSEADQTDLVGRIERTRARVERLATVEIPPPTLTFEDRLTLHLTWKGKPRTLRLLHLRGHTRGDVVVYLPEEDLLATGDLLDALPFGGHGYPHAWLGALDEVLRLDPQTVVPGHGPVFESTVFEGTLFEGKLFEGTLSEAQAQIRQVRGLLAEVVVQARGAVRRGKGLEEAREEMMGSPEIAALRESLAGNDDLARRVFESFVPATFDRAYLEAKGELPD